MNSTVIQDSCRTARLRRAVSVRFRLRRDRGPDGLIGFWRRTVRVVSGLAVEEHQDEEPDAADYRNEHDQYPPTAASGVVQPSNGNGDCRNEHRQRVDTA